VGALAGPATNIALALLAASAFHVLTFVLSCRTMGCRQPQKCVLIMSFWRSSIASDPALDVAGRSRIAAQRAGFTAVAVEPYGMLILIDF